MLLRALFAAIKLVTVVIFLAYGPLIFQAHADEKIKTTSNDANPDRTLLSEDSERLFFWSSGDSTPQIAPDQRVNDALDELYQSADIRNLPLPERGLVAMQHSYGAPSVTSVRTMGLSPFSQGASVTISTSSGESFTVDTKIPQGRTAEDAASWFESAFLEIAIDTKLDHDGDAALYFIGALFSDGKQTVLAPLEPCECGAGDVIAWLSKPPSELSLTTAPNIIVMRNPIHSGEWIVETGSPQTGIAYTISANPTNASSLDDADAMYAVRGDGGGHIIYVKTPNNCDKSPALEIYDKYHSVWGGKMRTTCERLDKDTLEYILEDGPQTSAIEPEIKAKKFMYFKASGKDHYFSLAGSSIALNSIEEGARSLGKLLTQELAASPLPGKIAQSLILQLRKPEVIKRPAAAMPTTDFISKYADGLARQLEGALHPACSAIGSQIRRAGSSGHPAEIRRRQVDAMFDRAPSVCL